MHFHMFTDPWYPGYISQKLEDMGDDRRDLANAIMVAGAMIAQAIDNAFGADCKGDGYDTEISSKESLKRIAQGIEEFLDRSGVPH